MSPTPQAREPMPASRTARRRRRMRDALLAAATASFVRRGIDAVSVEALLTEADVSRATFYQLFSSKNDLLQQILNPLLEDMARHVDALATRRPDQVVDGLVDVWLQLQRAHGDALLLLGRLGEADLGHRLAARRAAAEDGMLTALGRAERADVLRNGSARLSLRLVTAAAVPVLEVYAGHPGAEALFRDALRALLLRRH